MPLFYDMFNVRGRSGGLEFAKTCLRYTPAGVQVRSVVDRDGSGSVHLRVD
jgi:hypothetical protein